MSNADNKHVLIAGTFKETAKDDAAMGISIASSNTDSGNTGITIKSSSVAAEAAGTSIHGSTPQTETSGVNPGTRTEPTNATSGATGIFIKSSAPAVGHSIKGTAKESDNSDVEMDADNAPTSAGHGNNEISIKSAGGSESGPSAGVSAEAAKAPKVAASDAQSSVEGWVVIVTGVHEEAREEEVLDFFSDYGKVRGLHMNLDRQTGFVKGYALVEFEKLNEAEAAVKRGSGKRLLGQPIEVDFAFMKDMDADDETVVRGNVSDQEEGTLDKRSYDRRPRRGSRPEYRPNPRQNRQRELSPDRGF